jgi:hypothetical protein
VPLENITGVVYWRQMARRRSTAIAASMPLSIGGQFETARRPEVPAAGRTAAGDGVGEVMQRGSGITAGGGVQAKASSSG